MKKKRARFAFVVCVLLAIFGEVVTTHFVDSDKIVEKPQAQSNTSSQLNSPVK